MFVGIDVVINRLAAVPNGSRELLAMAKFAGVEVVGWSWCG